jgi:CheY-like chemotaxis protein
METGPIKVLLVEDNALDTRLFREWLSEIHTSEFELHAVPRLEDALARIDGERFDVVLTDLSLPDSHGLETFRTLHRSVPNIPVIVLSGVDDETVAVSAHGVADRGRVLHPERHLARALRPTVAGGGCDRGVGW